MTQVVELLPTNCEALCLIDAQFFKNVFNKYILKLDEMGNFLGKCKMTKLSQDETYKACSYSP
jgi:hypothetical protein